jgi:hypothetical protein
LVRAFAFLGATLSATLAGGGSGRTGAFALTFAFARVADAVFVRIELVRVGDQRAVVFIIIGAIAVVILVHTVGLAVFVRVDKAIIHRVIAIVVQAVAEFLRRLGRITTRPTLFTGTGLLARAGSNVVRCFTGPRGTVDVIALIILTKADAAARAGHTEIHGVRLTRLRHILAFVAVVTPAIVPALHGATPFGALRIQAHVNALGTIVLAVLIAFTHVAIGGHDLGAHQDRITLPHILDDRTAISLRTFVNAAERALLGSELIDFDAIAINLTIFVHTIRIACAGLFEELRPLLCAVVGTRIRVFTSLALAVAARGFNLRFLIAGVVDIHGSGVSNRVDRGGIVGLLSTADGKGQHDHGYTQQQMGGEYSKHCRASARLVGEHCFVSLQKISRLYQTSQKMRSRSLEWFQIETHLWQPSTHPLTRLRNSRQTS